MPKDRLPLIVGNWKMNKTVGDSMGFVEELVLETMDVDFGKVNVVVCPPFTALSSVRELLRKKIPIEVGAQNLNAQPEGPRTGEVSARMVAEFCSHVICGHSERRELFGETNRIVNEKVLAALGQGLRPILCVGENADQHDRAETYKVLETQLKECLNGLNAVDIKRAVIAYEPVWAISKGDGKGKTAAVSDVSEAHFFIRGCLDKLFGKGTGKGVIVIYGGSVNPENIGELIKDEEIDGFLPGGASLDPKKFGKMIKVCEKA